MTLSHCRTYYKATLHRKITLYCLEHNATQHRCAARNLQSFLLTLVLRRLLAVTGSVHLNRMLANAPCSQGEYNLDMIVGFLTSMSPGEDPVLDRIACEVICVSLETSEKFLTASRNAFLCVYISDSTLEQVLYFS